MADYAINTRDILNTLKLSALVEPLEALQLAFSNKLDTADNKALNLIAKLHLPQTKKKASATRVKITKKEELLIGKSFVMEADIQNVYLAMTSSEKDFNEIIKKDLGSIILEATTKESAIKGDEFTIKGSYYEETEEGATDFELDTAGAKVASAIKITAGANKGKFGIILHHEQLGNSMDIINNIFAIS
jgi:hypothetical protein